jgi:hypothetical protein
VRSVEIGLSYKPEASASGFGVHSIKGIRYLTCDVTLGTRFLRVNFERRLVGQDGILRPDGIRPVQVIIPIGGAKRHTCRLSLFWWPMVPNRIVPSRKPITNRPQDAILPHIKALRSLGFQQSHLIRGSFHRSGDSCDRLFSLSNQGERSSQMPGSRPATAEACPASQSQAIQSDCRRRQQVGSVFH